MEKNDRPDSQEKRLPELLNRVRDNIDGYLRDLSDLQLNTSPELKFRDSLEIVNAIGEIRKAIRTAQDLGVSDNEISKLLETRHYENIALFHLKKSIPQLYLAKDEQSLKYFEASLGFTTLLNIPPEKVARTWLSAVPMKERENELTSVISKCLQLDENVIEKLRIEFFSNKQNPKSSSDDPRLQVFREFVKREQKQEQEDENTFREDIKNSFRGRLDTLFEALIREPVGKIKSFYLERLFRDCGHFEFSLAETFGFNQKEINAVLSEYEEKSINILEKILHKYYLTSQNKSDFVSELNVDELSYLGVCLSTALYLVNINNKKCISKVLESFEEDERINVLLSTQKLFYLNNDEFIEIRKAKIS